MDITLFNGFEEASSFEKGALIAVVVGFIPSWFVRRHIVEPGNFGDRFALAGLFGASLLVVVFARFFGGQRERGILHIYTQPRAFAQAVAAARTMRQFGLDRDSVSAERCVEIEPALEGRAAVVQAPHRQEREIEGRCGDDESPHDSSQERRT